MTDTVRLPSDYVPFDKLVFCGNTLENCKIPLQIESRPIFLVGKGDLAKIWLNVPEKPESGAEWKYAVEANKVSFDRASITISGENYAVHWADNLVLQLAANTPTEAAITYLDLRPIGLNVHGDMRRLMVGTNTFEGNTFKNVHTMINLG